MIQFINLIKKSEKEYSNVFYQKDKIYTFVNSGGYLYARKDPSLYKNFDGIFIDGILMCKALRWIWGIRINRRSFDMTSMAKSLFEYLNDTSCQESIYFLGSKQEEVAASVNQFRINYLNMKIIGYRNGYFKDSTERTNVINEIIKLSPSFVIVGLGKPTQDIFALDLKNAGFKGNVFTCGGFLHQSCNNLYYYPAWIDKYNLRWLYRFIKEGTWPRLFNDIFYFPSLFIYDRIKSLFRKSKF